MSIEAILLIIAIALICAFGVALIMSIKKAHSGNGEHLSNDLSRLEGKVDNFSNIIGSLRKEMSDSVKSMGDTLSNNQRSGDEALEKRLHNFSLENEQKLENIRKTIEDRLGAIRDENSAALEKMRETVDEKLQKTLEERISNSFSQVSKRLEEVYKGLGEMQTLAAGVGDLNKVLSNVKRRGIIGEYQLGAILSEILTADQYEENAATKKGSGNRVEFAVKLPSDDDSFTYLPIDSKFPGDTYAALCDAYDGGDKEAIKKARKELRNTFINEAKDISTKYIDPPHTTEFAIMFLPFEGLYAEAVNSGLVEELQSKYKVNIAGPSTMAALLNSLQMGFKTLAVQKRSTEVWKVLEEVRTEFGKFTDALLDAQKRIQHVDSDLENLIGRRTRQMQRKLEKISSLEGEVPLIEN